MVLTAYTVAQQIEALIVLSNPDYTIKGWHGALLTIATAIFCVFFNTFLVRKLPLIEGFALTLHAVGFFVVLIVLWVMGPRGNAKVVFTDFEDNNGWGSLGLATLVGLLSPITTLIGADSVCHLSEELRDASWSLPRCMITTASINYVLGFLMTIALMFTIGNVEEVLSTPTGQPYVQVLLNATESRGATIVLTAMMALLLLFCAINQVTTSSRQLFAFARDHGLPYSEFLSYVSFSQSTSLKKLAITSY
jgi:amino acid transporter